jgi:hypothetical protein
MHWRGDRSVGTFGTDPFDPNVSLMNFDGAFQTLVGSIDLPSNDQMQAFATFQLQVQPPPNPVRNLDNSMTPSQQRGHDFYTGSRPADGLVVPGLDIIAGQSSFSCNGCHMLDPSQGFFGTNGNQSFENLTQTVKIPHLRNAYTKVGMFGDPSGFFAGDSGSTGDQIRGFGFLGDGSVDTIFHFLSAQVFNPTSTTGFPVNNPDGTRRDVEQFILAFDSDLAPVVGQQVTLTSVNAATAGPRIDLLIARAGAPFVSKSLGGTVTECDLVARVVQNGRIESFLYDPVNQNFIPDDGSAPLADGDVRALAATAGQEVTYLAATPGSGPRVAFGLSRSAMFRPKVYTRSQGR